MLEIFINIKTEISLGSIAGNSQAIKKRRDENYILLTSFILNQLLNAEIIIRIIFSVNLFNTCRIKSPGFLKFRSDICKAIPD